MLHSLLTFTSFSHMYADFKLKFNLQCLLFEHFRYDHSSVLIQPLRSHRLDPARPMSMHGPLHGCSARPNLEAGYQDPPGVLTLFEWVLFPLWFFKISCFIVIIKLKLGVSGVFSVFIQHYMYQTWMCVLQIHSLLLRWKKGKLL